MGAFFRGLITREEFKNPSSTRNKYRDEMKNRCVYVVMFFVYNILSFKSGFSLEPLCHTNVVINIFLPTHLLKTSDWRFAWQNGYGRHPLWSYAFMNKYKSFTLMNKYKSFKKYWKVRPSGHPCSTLVISSKKLLYTLLIRVDCFLFFRCK